MFLILRIVADLLWQYKAIAVILNILMFVYALVPRRRVTISKSAGIVLLTFFIFFLILFAAYLKKIDEDSTVLFLKVFLSFFLFSIGLQARLLIRDSILIAKLSVLIILCHFACSLLNIGYQLWGNVNTYSGIYFFKTDLATAMIICLIYCLYFLKARNWVRHLIIAISVYLIFISNARIHLLSVFLVLTVYFFRKQIIKRPKRTLFLGAPLVAIAFVLVISIVLYFLPSRFVSIDFDNFYSDSNMQGRNNIWDALITQFKAESVSNQISGLGLTADVDISKKFGAPDQAHNAHNTYLFILISMGYSGLLLFLLMIYLFLNRFFKLTSISMNNVERETFLMVFLSFMLVFLIASLSAVTIAFQQLTWFVFFWAGVLFNEKMFSINLPRKQIL